MTTAGNALLLALLLLLAVLVDRQSDILGNRSEAGGGFHPSVFPPHSGAIWILTNGSAILAAAFLIVLLTQHRVLKRQPPP